MNKKLLLIAPVLVFGLNEPLKVEAQDNCVIPNVPDNCQAARQITINKNSMDVSPPNICAAPGQTIPVQVRPIGETARVVSKGGADWLSGDGGDFDLAPTTPRATSTTPSTFPTIAASIRESRSTSVLGLGLGLGVG